MPDEPYPEGSDEILRELRTLLLVLSLGERAQEVIGPLIELMPFSDRLVNSVLRVEQLLVTLVRLAPFLPSDERGEWLQDVGTLFNEEIGREGLKVLQDWSRQMYLLQQHLKECGALFAPEPVALTPEEISRVVMAVAREVYGDLSPNDMSVLKRAALEELARYGI